MIHERYTFSIVGSPSEKISYFTSETNARLSRFVTLIIIFTPKNILSLQLGLFELIYIEIMHVVVESLNDLLYSLNFAVLICIKNYTCTEKKIFRPQGTSFEYHVLESEDFSSRLGLEERSRKVKKNLHDKIPFIIYLKIQALFLNNMHIKLVAVALKYLISDFETLFKPDSYFIYYRSVFVFIFVGFFQCQIVVNVLNFCLENFF